MKVPNNWLCCESAKYLVFYEFFVSGGSQMDPPGCKDKHKKLTMQLSPDLCRTMKNNDEKWRVNYLAISSLMVIIRHEISWYRTKRITYQLNKPLIFSGLFVFKNLRWPQQVTPDILYKINYEITIIILILYISTTYDFMILPVESIFQLLCIIL